eukprot:20944-Heterococcus_DN1.PRE.2
MMLWIAPTTTAVAASISYSEVLLEHHEPIRLVHATEGMVPASVKAYRMPIALLPYAPLCTYMTIK